MTVANVLSESEAIEFLFGDNDARVMSYFLYDHYADAGEYKYKLVKVTDNYSWDGNTYGEISADTFGSLIFQGTLTYASTTKGNQDLQLYTVRHNTCPGCCRPFLWTEKITLDGPTPDTKLVLTQHLHIVWTDKTSNGCYESQIIRK